MIRAGGPGIDGGRGVAAVLWPRGPAFRISGGRSFSRARTACRARSRPPTAAHRVPGSWLLSQPPPRGRRRPPTVSQRIPGVSKPAAHPNRTAQLQIFAGRMARWVRWGWRGSRPDRTRCGERDNGRRTGQRLSVMHGMNTRWPVATRGQAGRPLAVASHAPGAYETSCGPVRTPGRCRRLSAMHLVNARSARPRWPMARIHPMHL